MSSVLKALKKLEDNDSHRPRIQTWAHIDTKKTVSRRVRWFWLFNKCVSVLILLAIVAVIGSGWFILVRDPLLRQKLFSARLSNEKKAVSQPPADPKTGSGPATSVNPTRRKSGSEIPRKEKSLKQDRKNMLTSAEKRRAEPASFSDKKDAGPDLYQKKHPATVNDSVTKLYQKKLAALKRERKLRRTKRDTPPAALSEKKTGKPELGRTSAEKKTSTPKRTAMPSARKKNRPEPSQKRIASKDHETSGRKQKQTPSTKIKTEPSMPVNPPEKKASDSDPFAKQLPDSPDTDPSAKVELPEKEIARLKADDPQSHEPSPAEKPSAKHKLLSDSRFKIQALVWSGEAKNRMAVVNDQVVRIGGRVDGALVKHIGSDHIVLKEGKEEWTVNFRIK